MGKAYNLIRDADVSTRTYPGRKAPVCAELHGNLLFIGTDDPTIEVIDLRLMSTTAVVPCIAVPSQIHYNAKVDYIATIEGTTAVAYFNYGADQGVGATSEIVPTTVRRSGRAFDLPQPGDPWRLAVQFAITHDNEAICLSLSGESGDIAVGSREKSGCGAVSLYAYRQADSPPSDSAPDSTEECNDDGDLDLPKIKATFRRSASFWLARELRLMPFVSFSFERTFLAARSEKDMILLTCAKPSTPSMLSQSATPSSSRTSLTPESSYEDVYPRADETSVSGGSKDRLSWSSIHVPSSVRHGLSGLFGQGSGGGRKEDNGNEDAVVGKGFELFGDDVIGSYLSSVPGCSFLLYSHVGSRGPIHSCQLFSCRDVESLYLLLSTDLEGLLYVVEDNEVSKLTTISYTSLTTKCVVTESLLYAFSDNLVDIYCVPRCSKQARDIAKKLSEDCFDLPIMGCQPFRSQYRVVSQSVMCLYSRRTRQWTVVTVPTVKAIVDKLMKMGDRTVGEDIPQYCKIMALCSAVCQFSEEHHVNVTLDIADHLLKHTGTSGAVLELYQTAGVSSYNVLKKLLLSSKSTDSVDSYTLDLINNTLFGDVCVMVPEEDVVKHLYGIFESVSSHSCAFHLLLHQMEFSGDLAKNAKPSVMGESVYGRLVLSHISLEQGNMLRALQSVALADFDETVGVLSSHGHLLFRELHLTKYGQFLSFHPETQYIYRDVLKRWWRRGVLSTQNICRLIQTGSDPSLSLIHEKCFLENLAVSSLTNDGFCHQEILVTLCLVYMQRLMSERPLEKQLRIEDRTLFLENRQRCKWLNKLAPFNGNSPSLRHKVSPTLSSSGDRSLSPSASLSASNPSCVCVYCTEELLLLQGLLSGDLLTSESVRFVQESLKPLLKLTDQGDRCASARKEKLESVYLLCVLSVDPDSAIPWIVTRCPHILPDILSRDWEYEMTSLIQQAISHLWSTVQLRPEDSQVKDLFMEIVNVAADRLPYEDLIQSLPDDADVFYLLPQIIRCAEKPSVTAPVADTTS